MVGFPWRISLPQSCLSCKNHFLHSAPLSLHAHCPPFDVHSKMYCTKLKLLVRSNISMTMCLAGFGQRTPEGVAWHLAAEWKPLGGQEAWNQIQDWLLWDSRQLQMDPRGSGQLLLPIHPQHMLHICYEPFSVTLSCLVHHRNDNKLSQIHKTWERILNERVELILKASSFFPSPSLLEWYSSSLHHAWNPLKLFLLEWYAASLHHAWNPF